jgi:hypothetical protein
MTSALRLHLAYFYNVLLLSTVNTQRGHSQHPTRILARSLDVSPSTIAAQKSLHNSLHKPHTFSVSLCKEMQLNVYNTCPLLKQPDCYSEDSRVTVVYRTSYCRPTFYHIICLVISGLWIRVPPTSYETVSYYTSSFAVTG